ncbi:Fc.00g046610.m01.CDS01 [Cosmosporella sp. VM-42]
MPQIDKQPAAEPGLYGADNFLYHTIRAPRAKQMELATRIRMFLWSKERVTAWIQLIWEEGESLRLSLMFMQLKSTILKEDLKLEMRKRVTPFQILALVANEKLFSKVVLQAGECDWASVHDVDSEGRTVLHWAAGREENINEYTTSDEDTSEGEIITKLVDQGLNPKTPANNGCSPLHIVAQRGRQDNLMALIGQNIDLNVKDQASFTPLHVSVIYPGSIERLKDLLSAGAKVEVCEED